MASPPALVQASGIDAARLASYDRAIREEPSFKSEQVEGLTRDLTAYLTTLKVSPDVSAPIAHKTPPPAGPVATTFGCCACRCCCSLQPILSVWQAARVNTGQLAATATITTNLACGTQRSN